MSNNNDTELPQASPGETIEDKLNKLLHCQKMIDIGHTGWEKYIDEIIQIKKDIQAIITTETTRKEHEARMNLLEYFDQIPKNEHMDWKGLIADCKRLLKEEQE